MSLLCETVAKKAKLDGSYASLSATLVESGFPAEMREDDMKLAFSLQTLDEKDPFELGVIRMQGNLGCYMRVCMRYALAGKHSS